MPTPYARELAWQEFVQSTCTTALMRGPTRKSLLQGTLFDEACIFQGGYRQVHPCCRLAMNERMRRLLRASFIFPAMIGTLDAS